jgi:hypothetical protein
VLSFDAGEVPAPGTVKFFVESSCGLTPSSATCQPTTTDLVPDVVACELTAATATVSLAVPPGVTCKGGVILENKGAAGVTARVSVLARRSGTLLGGVSYLLRNAPATGPDRDGDGVIDDADNCVGVANAGQADPTGAGIGSACPIEPLLTCVEDVGDGVLRAHFGYVNNDTVLKSLDIGKFNLFTPSPADRRQVSAFLPGLHQDAFSVIFSGTLTWNLNGVTVMASSSSPPCSGD